MAPPFGSGMSQRKVKSLSPKIQASLGINDGNAAAADDDDDKSSSSKGVFRRSKYRGKYAASLFVALVLGPTLMIYASTQFSGTMKSKNPGWGKHPRVVTLWREAETEIHLGAPIMARLPEMSHEVVPMAKKSFFERLEDSHSYDGGRADQFETATCKAQYEWQLHSFPTCNLLHEREMESLIVRSENKEEPLKLVANGYWRDVWILPSSNFDGNHVLKTIRYQHDWEERNYDRHRRDALAMERLSDNPYVLNLYAFCGNSGVSEYADGGDISDAIWPHNPETEKREYATITKLERLHIGVQAAMGLAAVHNCDKEGRPSIAHTDISPGQFVRVGNIFKLNDFNRARFLRTNITDGSICGFEVGNNPGKNRSPEEYMYQPETEKIDVYSLGNIFYMLLMDQWPFKGVKEKKAIKMIMNGRRPEIYTDVWNSTDPSDVALKNAMFMCHEQDPKIRSTSREVETYLLEQLEKIDPGRLDTWPKPRRVS